MKFSESLRRFRQERGLTQRAVANAADMPEVTYQRYEYGLREPAFKQLIAIADALDVSIDYLVGRTDNPAINN